MWLPAPLYEALPTAYVIVGALLLGGAFYVGFDGSMSIAYAGLGAICILAGIIVRQRRSKIRQSRIDES